MSQERYLKVDDVAELLDVRPETVRRWLRRGELRGILLGRKGGFRIAESDFRTFIESRKLAA